MLSAANRGWGQALCQLRSGVDTGLLSVFSLALSATTRICGLESSIHGLEWIFWKNNKPPPTATSHTTLFNDTLKK